MKKVLDREWVDLLLLAKEQKISKEEIELFISQKKKEKQKKLPV